MHKRVNTPPRFKICISLEGQCRFDWRLPRETATARNSGKNSSQFLMFIIRSEQAQLRPPRGPGGRGFVQPGKEKAAGGSDYSFPLPKLKWYSQTFPKRCTVKWQETTDTSCNKGNSSWDRKKTTFQWVVQSWDKVQPPSLGTFKTQLQKKPLSNTEVRLTWTGG